MRVLDVDQDSSSWIAERRGRITGSKLKDLYSSRGERKDGFYQLIADNLILLEDDESDSSDRDRGHTKELEAVEMFMSETGKVADTKPGMWIADFNDRIAISPDGGIKNKKGIYTEAVEVKCYAAKNHIKAICRSMDGLSDRQILKEEWLQVVHYFTVNEDLKTLHFIFYDDRITALPFFMIDVQREQVQEDVDKFRIFEEKLLSEVDKYVNKLAFGL